MNKFSFYFLSILLAFFFTACQQATLEPTAIMTDVPTKTATVMHTATETMMPSPSSTATKTPKPTKTPRPTGTITPTPTPTAPIIKVDGNPVRQGTRLPEVETITLDNIDQLEEIGRWGYDTFSDIILTEDENHVLALSSLGVIWFDARTMRETKLVEMNLSSCGLKLQFSPSGNYVMCFLTEPTKFDYVDSRIIGLSLLSKEDGSLYKSIEIDQARSAWLAPDDQRLFIADREVQVWDVLRDKWIENVTYSNFPDMRFIDDGSTFIVFDPAGGGAYLLTEDEEPRELPSSGTYYNYNTPYPPISPDGKYVAGDWSGSGKLFVKEVLSGETLFTYCYDLTQCSNDSSNASSSKLAREVMFRDGPWAYTGVDYMAISPDNKYLVASIHIEHDDFLYYIEIPSGKLIRKEAGKARNVIFFNKSTDYLDWSSTYIRKKNIYEGSINQYVPEPYYSSTTAEISDDSNLLVTGDENRIEVYNLLDGIMANYIEIDDPVSDIALFHHSPKVLAGKGWEEDEAIVWDYFTGEISSYRTDLGYGYVADYLEVQVTADDQFIRYFIDDTSNYTFNVATGAFIPEMFIDALVNPVKPEVAYIWKGDIELYQIDPKTLEYQLQDTIKSPGCYGFWEGYSSGSTYLPDGDGFACVTDNEVIIFGDFGEERLPYSKSVPDIWEYLKPVFTITNDNSMLLLSHEGNIAAVYDVFTNEKIYELSLPGTSLVQFTPDNNYLVTLGSGGVFRIFGVPVEGND